jgi:methionine synthase II (cobalamin-independent)
VAMIERQIVPSPPGLTDHHPSHGRPYKYSPETIERCLYEVAACGGNANRAAQVLQEAELFGPEGKPIPARTIRSWVTGPFRNRYQEIVQAKAKALDDIIKDTARANAIRFGEAEQEALKQTLAGLSHANAVEASTVLRNVSQAKKTSVEVTGAIGLRPLLEQQSEDLMAIAKSLERMQVMKIRYEGDEPEPVDAEVVELEPGG